MNRVKIWILNHRIIFLIITVAGLAVATYYIATCCGLANEILKISIALFALSLSTLLVLSMYKIYDIQKQLDKRFIDWFLDNRKCSLLGAGILGLVFAFATYYVATCFCLTNDILKSSITILALGLPTFFILWMFRTHDVQEQLKKAEEQLKKTEESTNNNTFFECARLLAAEPPLSKKIALIQLAYLRRETSFDKEKIDSTTKNISLNGQDLSFAQLRGINLSGALLINTSFREADLRGVNFRKAKELNVNKFYKAKYDDETDFTGTSLDGKDVPRDKAGMEYIPDEEDSENKSESDR